MFRNIFSFSCAPVLGLACAASAEASVVSVASNASGVGTANEGGDVGTVGESDIRWPNDPR